MTNEPQPKSVARKIATIALEIVLVAIIIGLVVATWLPAMIGANPDYGAPMARHHNLR
jgi:hypothetical protein